MKPCTYPLLTVVTATVFSLWSVAGLATPKAAEHKDAPVTTGAHVAKPKISAKSAKPEVKAKTKATSKGKPSTPAQPKKKS